jgi:UDP-N-acetylglucosamine 2-epimerase (non-hydrolysing)
MCVFGTRPEAIKMAPVVRRALAAGGPIEPVVCVTAQHREMLDQVLAAFRIRPEIDLGVMRQNQTLASLTGSLMTALDEVRRPAARTWLLVRATPPPP